MPGIHSASSGKSTNIKIISNIGIRKGSVPTAISIMEYCGKTLLIVNKFNPNGGVTKPISARITYVTPHQIGSNPSSLMIGITKGSVNTIIERASWKWSIDTRPRLSPRLGRGRVSTDTVKTKLDHEKISCPTLRNQRARGHFSSEPPQPRARSLPC